MSLPGSPTRISTYFELVKDAQGGGSVPHFMTKSHLNQQSKSNIKMKLVMNAPTYVPGKEICGDVTISQPCESVQVEICGYEEVYDKTSKLHPIHLRLFLRLNQKVEMQGNQGTFNMTLPIHGNLDDDIGNVRTLPASFWNSSYGGIRYIVTCIAKKNGVVNMQHKEIQVLQPALPILGPLEMSAEKYLGAGLVNLTAQTSGRWISGTNGRIHLVIDNSTPATIHWVRGSIVRILSVHGRSFDPVQKGTYQIEGSRRIVADVVLSKRKDSNVLQKPHEASWSEDAVYNVGYQRSCEYWNGVVPGQTKQMEMDIVIPLNVADVRGAFCQVSHVVQVAIGSGNNILCVTEVPVVVTRGEVVKEDMKPVHISSIRTVVPAPLTIPLNQFTQMSLGQISPISPPSPERGRQVESSPRRMDQSHSPRRSSLRNRDGSPTRIESFQDKIPIPASPVRMSSRQLPPLPQGVSLFGPRADRKNMEMRESKPVMIERVSEWDEIEEI